MCATKTINVETWLAGTFQKKAIAVGVAALLTPGSTNLHAAEGASASGGASEAGGAAGAGGALGGISVAAADASGVVGVGLIVVAAEDDGTTTPARPVIEPPAPPTTTSTATTATSTTGT